MRATIFSLLLVLPHVSVAAPSVTPGVTPAVTAEELRYDADFAPWADHAEHITAPETVLGAPVGTRSAFPAEIIRLFETWAAESPRAELHRYAESHEGRPLVYMVITSEANHARMPEIRAAMDALGDPRGLDGDRAEALIGETPAIAWMAYSIHGNETSGSDAAVALAHHLVADQSPRTAELLEDTVVIVDPMMNPDGRHRFLTQNAETRGEHANVDHQSLLHTGYWPGGRTNHYLFDLNRDWILGVHPETRGRIREAARWNPVFFVDAHEQGALDTYLFSPAREPLNPYFPASVERWIPRFAEAQAQAFDAFGWRYYTGEWNEGWYPGYSNAWATFNGAIGFLYEQARIAEDGVRRQEGWVMTYREGVHHQFVSSVAHLEALAENRQDILADFLRARRQAVDPGADIGDPVFVVRGDGDATRLATLTELFLLQDFEVFETTERESLRRATDQLGHGVRDVSLPAGSLVIPARQPRAHLIRAMLDFDPRMSEQALLTEREDILAGRGSGIYDTTAWNLTMMYGLPAYTTERAPDGLRRIQDTSPGAAPTGFARGESVVAWVVDAAHDGSVALAARLARQGLPVRVATEAFRLEEQDFPRGSVVLMADDLRSDREAGLDALAETAGAMGLAVTAVGTGLGPGDLADLGGGKFPLLEAPRVAMLSRGDTSAYDFGAIWHHLDHRLGIGSSHLDERDMGFRDLRRYNVLVAPDRYGPGLEDIFDERLAEWVRAGGTLILVGDSADDLLASDSGDALSLGHVRTLPQVLEADDPEEAPSRDYVRALPPTLEALADYDLDVQRSWLADRAGEVLDRVWRHRVNEDPDGPWRLAEYPAPEELERRDRWQAQFMPQGAMVAARTDGEHWLTLGVDPVLPVLFGDDPLLMTTDEAPVRLGVYVARDGVREEPARAGWATLPPDRDQVLRMSGLLWPEAANRIADAAWVTRDAVGAGQVIRFASPPVFRGATLGTARVLSNAIVYGPGLGASQPLD